MLRANVRGGGTYSAVGLHRASGTPAAAGNQGAWSEEETEKLKKLAEESKTQGSHDNGEIDWDWVCNAWGPGRTRFVENYEPCLLG